MLGRLELLEPVYVADALAWKRSVKSYVVFRLNVFLLRSTLGMAPLL